MMWQFFMTDQSLFVLVIDVSKALEEERVRYWLDSIRFRTSQHRCTMVVVSKCDLVDDQHVIDNRIEQIQQCIRDTTSSDWMIDKPIIKAAFNNSQGVDEIRATLVQAAEALEDWNQQQPLRWVRFEERIRDISSEYRSFDQAPEQQQQAPASSTTVATTKMTIQGGYLEMAQVCKIASECDIGQHELASAIKFLVKIGSLVHFDDQQPTRATTTTTTEQPPTNTSTNKLAEYVFCSAQWLVDVLKCLINDNHRFRGVYQTNPASQQPML
jgi:tRNA U34 5-carboxymethylaminomethyl modifying GTPase MnmE/TrmE